MVWSYMMPFRKIIFMVVNNGLLQSTCFSHTVLRKRRLNKHSDQRGNHTPNQWYIQEEKLRTDPQSIHLLHVQWFEPNG